MNSLDLKKRFSSKAGVILLLLASTLAVLGGQSFIQAPPTADTTPSWSEQESSNSEMQVFIPATDPKRSVDEPFVLGPLVIRPHVSYDVTYATGIQVNTNKLYRFAVRTTGKAALQLLFADESADKAAKKKLETRSDNAKANAILRQTHLKDLYYRYDSKNDMHQLVVEGICLADTPNVNNVIAEEVGTTVIGLNSCSLGLQEINGSGHQHRNKSNRGHGGGQLAARWG